MILVVSIAAGEMFAVSYAQDTNGTSQPAPAVSIPRVPDEGAKPLAPPATENPAEGSKQEPVAANPTTPEVAPAETLVAAEAAPAPANRKPSSLAGVDYEVLPDGSAVFYPAKRPFTGVAVSDDGRNVYIGN